MKTPIQPYVTAKGGIVILNGPFPIDEAHLIATKIEQSYAAYEDLLHLAQYVSHADFKYGFNRKQAKHLALKALAHFQFQKKENAVLDAAVVGDTSSHHSPHLGRSQLGTDFKESA